MPRPTLSDSSPEGDDNALLSALLHSEVPSRHGQLRPARLRSTTQQRQEALRGFRLRTWLDQALYLLERTLVVAAVFAFAYWLLDGYGRDWLHGLGQAHAATVPTPTPPISLPPAAAPAPQAAPAHAAPTRAPSLPFTHPEDALTPTAGALTDSFLAPQPLHPAPDLSDPLPHRLSMPSISADMAVTEVFVRNDQWQVAEYAAGFHHGSAMPGTVGNSVFSGHAGLRGSVFKDIGRLKPGDEVIVETGGWRYVYRVRGSLSVWPNQIEVMAQTPTPVLTLITCTNWDTQRLVVVADLVGARPIS